jgi:hypothetical protein
MSQENKRPSPLEQRIPDKCVQCPFLDQEHDHLAMKTRLYCLAPWWRPKRWFCKTPDEVERG